MAHALVGKRQFPPPINLPGIHLLHSSSPARVCLLLRRSCQRSREEEGKKEALFAAAKDPSKEECCHRDMPIAPTPLRYKPVRVLCREKTFLFIGSGRYQRERGRKRDQIRGKERARRRVASAQDRATGWTGIRTRNSRLT